MMVVQNLLDAAYESLCWSVLNDTGMTRDLIDAARMVLAAHLGESIVSAERIAALIPELRRCAAFAETKNCNLVVVYINDAIEGLLEEL